MCDLDNSGFDRNRVPGRASTAYLSVKSIMVSITMQKRENKKRGKYFDVSIALHGIYDGAFTVYMKIHSSIPVLLECICPLTVCKRNTKL